MIKILFWLLLLIDLGLGAIVHIAGGFKRSFSPQGSNYLAEIVLIICLIAGLILMYGMKKPVAGLTAVAAPLVLLLLARLAD